MLAKLQVCGIRWFIVVEKHQVDVGESASRVESLDRVGAGTDNDLDRITQTCQVYQRHDHSRKFWISFQTEIPLAPRLSHGISEQNAGIPAWQSEFQSCCWLRIFLPMVPDISTKLYHDLWLPVGNQVYNDLPFVVTDIHEILFGASIFVNGFQDFLGRASNVVYGGMAVYEM